MFAYLISVSNNIKVSYLGDVRFRDVTIIKNLTPEQLPEGIWSNYVSAHAVIKDDTFSGAPPAEIHYFFNKILTDDGRELFHIHAFLLLATKYHSFLRRYMII
jgi:hypothetical protein